VLTTSAARDARLLFHHDIAVGADGYYYVIQTSHLVEDGHLYFPTPSRGFLYIAAGMTRLVGNPINCIKMLSLTLHSLLVLGMFLLLRKLTASVWLGILGSTLAELSALHLYFIAEFNSNLCALTFLIWGLVFAGYGVALTSQFRWIHYTTGLLLLAAAGASHVSAIPLVAVVVACAAVVSALLRGGRSAQVGLAGLTMAWLTPIWLAYLMPSKLPSWAENSFQTHASWPVVDVGRPEKLFLLLAAPLLLALIVTSTERFAHHTLFFVGTGAMFSLLVLLNPFLNFSGVTTNLPGRLSLLSYLLVSLLAPCLIWMVLQIAPRWVPLAVCLVLGFGVITTRSARPSGLGDEYLSRCEQLIVDLRSHAAELDRDSVVVARPGDDFVVTATLGIPSQWQVPINVKPEKTFWLIDHVPTQMLAPSMLELSFEDGSATVLATNQELVALLRTSNPKELKNLELYNPHLYRATQSGSTEKLRTTPQ